jgi:ribosomal protein S18 acetylase RimI-like enzyme
MEATLEELAEHTEVHLLPRATFETVEREGFVYLAGLRSANLHPYRVENVTAAVEWSRAESHRRGHRDIEWWVGWRAEPDDLADALLELGVVRSADPPTLTGMTTITAPPAAAHIEVRRIETVEDYTDALEVDWEVWQLSAEERVSRRELDFARFDEMHALGTVHHFAAYLDGQRVGFGRAIDMPTAVALFGGAVLEEARGNGVYRALVRARWEHAVARATPVLAVQAGPMSAPILDRLGFRRHGDVRLFIDRL